MQAGRALAEERRARSGRRRQAEAGAGGGTVLHASEVNLVRSSMKTGFPNVVNTVLPHVALDMVSYSSYDTQGKGGPLGYRAALTFIAEHTNRTAESPREFVYIGEYGTKQEVAPFSATQAVNEVAAAAVLGNDTVGPLDFVARACFWEVYGNDLVDGPSGGLPVPGSSMGRGGKGLVAGGAGHALPGWLLARAESRRAEIEGYPGIGSTQGIGSSDFRHGSCTTEPVFNASQLGGLWLVKPDGSRAWPYDYLRGRILDGAA